MGRKIDVSVQSAATAVVATCTEMFILDVEPADRAACIASSLIGNHTIAGSFTQGAGGGGYQVTTPQEADISITTDGTANHVALCDGTTLIAVTTTTTPQGLSSGGTVTIPAFTFTVQDPPA